MNSDKESRQTNPLQNVFSDVEKILDFMEVKDLKAANDAETTDSKNAAEMWMNAKLEKDNYITYKNYWNIGMFKEVASTAKLIDIQKWINNPLNVPNDFRNNLLIKGREAFLNSYEETNDYYRILNGLPPYNTPESEYIYLSEPVRNQLHATDIPVHMLSALIQNNYMATDEYKQVLADNPDKTYLKYLGIYKIDIFTARNAKDFEIIRYPLNHADINSNLLNAFSSLYNDYREYVMVALYNENFEGLYKNYRTFMGMMIIAFTLMQISNKGVESINNCNFIDDSVLHTLLSMYGIPDSLLLTNEVRRNLAIHMKRLIQEKGTDEVYSDLINIMGYQDVEISKLLLMKGQQFDKTTGDPIKDENGNNKYEPYFLQVSIDDKNPYDTISSGNAPKYSYHDIIDSDPTWWDLVDTRKLLQDKLYSEAYSKYVSIHATVHQMKYIFESIYFSRMILDNKQYTDDFTIEIPEVLGTQKVSIFDLIIFLISAACMNYNLSGKIFTDKDHLYATTGFNFDMDLDSFTEYVNNTKYVDKEKLMSFMENLTMHSSDDINRIFNDIMYPLREWLELKISRSTNRDEYIEYENIYKSLFTYDASNNVFMNNFEMPLETIRKEYDISSDDLLAFQHFFPRTMTGEVITIDTYKDSRYKDPFISRYNVIDWFIHIIIETPYGEDDRGYLYFHDILNNPDLRTLANPDGTRIFMDYKDEEKGWEINKQAVDKAIELIDKLPDDMLRSAAFQVQTPILNSGGKQFAADEKLPAKIRTEIYKNILKEKITMDIQGLCVPADTYSEYLFRKNKTLYNILMDGRFENNKEAWLNDIMSVITAVETELNIHMKYFEQSILGPELFFKPLLTMMNFFKSTFVKFTKSGLSYQFGDKMDTGGNSNMFKMFDEVQFVIHFVTMANRGFDSQFGLYDTEHLAKYHINLNDRSEIFRMTSTGFDATVREARMGSIHMVDEIKFYKNGEPIDPTGYDSFWISGEPGTGRWSEEDNIIFRAREKVANAKLQEYDLDGWKNFVESYNQ